MKRWLPFAVFAVLLAFLFVGLWLDPREVPSPFIGKPAPAFSLPVLERARDELVDFRGEGMSIMEMSHRGKVVDSTVEGRERYGIRVAYPRERRDRVDSIDDVLVHGSRGPVPWIRSAKRFLSTRRQRRR